MTYKQLSEPIRDFIHPVRTAVHMDQTVGEAIQSLREKKIEAEIIYIYVVDDEKRLIGIVPTRRLLLSDSALSIHKIMETSVVTLHGGQTLQEAMEVLETHRLLALPVIDENRHLLGIIDVEFYLEERMDLANSRMRLELFQLMGLVIEEGKHSTPVKGYKLRMPWIFCTMFSGISCAVISRVFELVLAKVLLLAMFIPLVLSMSESISMQSMTHSIQLLRRPTQHKKHLRQSLIREWQIVVLLAVSCGLIIGALSLLWGDGVHPAMVISFGIMISVTISATIGSLLPLILHARKWDPKVAAGPVALMFADILTTLIYLSLGAYWLL